MSKWWLVSDEALRAVQAGLAAPTHEANDYNCQDWPPGDGCTGCDGDELRSKARHELSCGTHATNAVPTECQNEEEAT